MAQFAAEVAQNVVSEQLKNYISSSRKRGPGQLVFALPDESLAGREQIKRHVGTMKEFLDDEKARVLTIYGVRGIGKTTLLKKFNDELVENDAVRRRVYDTIIPSNGRRRRFDHVIFIHVSRSPNIENIKRDIEEQTCGNSSSLSSSIFLLLLDDVWNEVDLTSIGIPIPSNKNECKVILTSRSKSHCRINGVNMMTSTQFLEVAPLSEIEARNFF